jgi:hypothetical protein
MDLDQSRRRDIYLLIDKDLEQSLIMEVFKASLIPSHFEDNVWFGSRFYNLNLDYLRSGDFIKKEILSLPEDPFYQKMSDRIADFIFL